MTRPDDNFHGIKVYRFQPCYDVTGGLRGLNISPDSLWFSTPRNLNDPMDIDHPLVDLMEVEGGDSPVLREMTKVMYAREQNRYPRDLITDDLLVQIRLWAENGGHSFDIRRRFRERLQQIGVACFSTNWDSSPMWAHYGSNWQGFAIEYSICEIPIALENKALWPLWVNYHSRIEQTSLSELLFSPFEAVSRILSTKTIPWSYEKEWRLIHLGGGDHLLKMPVGMNMTGIVLGPKSPYDQTELFAEKCAEWNLPLRRVNVGLDRNLHLSNRSF
jgi:hypothetical protein